jgi:hypothetical protein
MEQNEPISTLKILICRKYSFQNITQFSQENNVLPVTVSNIDVFHLRDISVSST